MQRYKFVVSLPQPTGNDVTRDRWELLTVVGGVEQPATTGPIADITTTILIPVLEGGGSDPFSLSLVHVDKAGNRSEPRTLAFQQADDVAPAMPGEFGITLDSIVEE